MSGWVARFSGNRKLRLQNLGAVWRCGARVPLRGLASQHTLEPDPDPGMVCASQPPLDPFQPPLDCVVKWLVPHITLADLQALGQCSRAGRGLLDSLSALDLHSLVQVAPPPPPPRGTMGCGCTQAGTQRSSPPLRHL